MVRTVGARLLVFSVLAFICTTSQADESCLYDEERDGSLARYIYELYQNRQPTCESGGDFLREPAEISYSVTSFCRTPPNATGVSLVTPTFSFINCDTNEMDTLSIDVAVQEQCEGSPVFYPMKYTVGRVEDMPNGYTCPDGFEQVEIADDPDENFSREWEFRHAVENYYKYAEGTSGCNAYVRTETNVACYSETQKQYQGFGTITLQCVDSGKKEKVSVYIEAIDQGRSVCPWPEIVNGSPGYDPAFSFLQQNDTVAIEALVPSASTTANLDTAIRCIESNGIAVITSGPALEEKSKVWNKLNDSTIALAVVEPSTEDDVAISLSCLFANNVSAVAKSGGHSYDGYSVLPTAVTIDLGNMAQVIFNPVDNTSVVQAGSRLGQMYYEISNQSSGTRGAVGGTCPAVGAGGHVLGGGIGFLNRMHGLACDQVLSITMANYKGDIITATPTNDHKDLFWASCGGGGGNFGIVTSFLMKTVPVPPRVTYFDIEVTENAVDFLLHLQNNVSRIADPRIGGLQVNPLADQSVYATGLYLGPQSELESVLTSSGISSDWYSNLNSKEMSWIESTVRFAGIGKGKSPEDMIDIDNLERTGRSYFNLNSIYVIPSNPLPREAFEEMFEWIQANSDGFIELNLLGPRGKVASLNSGNTAYAYRDALYSVQYGNEWQNPDLGNTLILQTELLTNRLEKYMGTPTPPRVINYLDVQTPSMTGYYGANVDRLRVVKSQYDPNNYFKNPLTIPPVEIPSELGSTPNGETNVSTTIIPGEEEPPSTGAAQQCHLLVAELIILLLVIVSV